MQRLGIAILTLAAAAALRADDWPAARRTEVFSANGERFVRIVPGASYGETVGFSGSPKGPHARAEHYERQPDRSFRLVADFELLNPVAPVTVLLSDSGALIAFDNWHNAGYGAVAAIYSRKGSVVASYRLEDLYPEAELAKVPTSVSSRWWRCDPWGWSDPDKQTRAYVHATRGGYFVFDLRDGGKAYEAGASPWASPCLKSSE